MIVTNIRQVGNSAVVTLDRETREKANLGVGDLVKVSCPAKRKVIIELVAFAGELRENEGKEEKENEQ